MGNECFIIIIYIYIYSRTHGICKQTNFKTILKWILNRSCQRKFLESLHEISGSSCTTTNNRKLLRPSEINKSIVLEENIMEVLENSFLSPFHDELDAASSKILHLVNPLMILLSTAFCYLRKAVNN